MLPAPVSKSDAWSPPDNRYMNGPSKFVHCDWSRMYVFGAYSHVWILGSFPRSLPLTHVSGKLPAGGEVVWSIANSSLSFMVDLQEMAVYVGHRAVGQNAETRAPNLQRVFIRLPGWRFFDLANACTAPSASQWPVSCSPAAR